MLSEGNDFQWDNEEAEEGEEVEKKQARGVADHYTEKTVGWYQTATRAWVEHVYCERAKNVLLQ